jgi:hypothetical protein
MKARIPPSARAERVDFARDYIRQLPSVRLSRVRRRVAIVGLYLLLVATAIVLRVGPATWATGWPELMKMATKGYAAIDPLTIALTTLVMAQVVVFLVVNYSIRSLATRFENLDERERTERVRATAVAYKLLSAAVVVLTFYAIAAVTTSQIGAVAPRVNSEPPAATAPRSAPMLMVFATTMARMQKPTSQVGNLRRRLSPSPIPVCSAIRAQSSCIANISGKVNSAVQRTPKPNWAPACE